MQAFEQLIVVFLLDGRDVGIVESEVALGHVRDLAGEHDVIAHLLVEVGRLTVVKRLEGGREVHHLVEGASLRGQGLLVLEQLRGFLLQPRAADVVFGLGAGLAQALAEIGHALRAELLPLADGDEPDQLASARRQVVEREIHRHGQERHDEQRQHVANGQR